MKKSLVSIIFCCWATLTTYSQVNYAVGGGTSISLHRTDLNGKWFLSYHAQFLLSKEYDKLNYSIGMLLETRGVRKGELFHNQSLQHVFVVLPLAVSCVVRDRLAIGVALEPSLTIANRFRISEKLQPADLEDNIENVVNVGITPNIYIRLNEQLKLKLDFRFDLTPIRERFFELNHSTNEITTFMQPYRYQTLRLSLLKSL